MVAGLSPISDGGIVVAGKEIDGPGPDRSVVFQAPCFYHGPPPTKMLRLV